jgi:hypothetical protein
LQGVDDLRAERDHETNWDCGAFMALEKGSIGMSLLRSSKGLEPGYSADVPDLGGAVQVELGRLEVGVARERLDRSFAQQVAQELRV